MPVSDLLVLGPSVPLPLASCLALPACSFDESLSGWGGKRQAAGMPAEEYTPFNLFRSAVSFLISDRTLQKPEDHRHIPTHLYRIPEWEGMGCPCDPHGCPFSPLTLPPLAGPSLPAVRGDLPGVWPHPGEKLAALQGVHPAGAGQASGEYTAPRGRQSPQAG